MISNLSRLFKHRPLATVIGAAINAGGAAVLLSRLG